MNTMYSGKWMMTAVRKVGSMLRCARLWREGSLIIVVPPHPLSTEMSLTRTSVTFLPCVCLLLFLLLLILLLLLLLMLLLLYGDFFPPPRNSFSLCIR